MAVNHKVGGSSPPSSDIVRFLFFGFFIDEAEGVTRQGAKERTGTQLHWFFFQSRVGNAEGGTGPWVGQRECWAFEYSGRRSPTQCLPTLQIFPPSLKYSIILWECLISTVVKTERTV